MPPEIKHHCSHVRVAHWTNGKMETHTHTTYRQSIIFLSLYRCLTFFQSGHREPVDSMLLLPPCQPVVPGLWWLIKKLWNSRQLSLSLPPNLSFLWLWIQIFVEPKCVCVCVFPLIWLQTQVISEISLCDLPVKSQLARWVCGCGDVSPAVRGSIC